MIKYFFYFFLNVFGFVPYHRQFSIKRNDRSENMSFISRIAGVEIPVSNLKTAVDLQI